MKNMKRISGTAIALILIFTALLPGFATLSCSSKGYSGPVEAITIGATSIELNALLYVAEARGFLADNGIEVNYKEYETGASAAQGLLRAEVDISTTFESVIVTNVFQKQDVVDLATIDRSILFYIIGRADRGIKTIADLRGRRIGVPRQTIMEFYLGRTLELNGMNLEQVTMVDMKPSDSEATMAAGDLDAIITFEPHVTQVRKQMGDAVTLIPVQNGQMAFWSMVSTRAWVNQHTNLVKRLLKSLAQAEEYVNLHEAETKKFLLDKLKYDEAYIETRWPQNDYSLSLNQQLILTIEDEARWMISNNLTTEKTVPNFLDYIYAEGLKAAKPGSVTIAGK
jgi:ABC-type nitrate/sulfonate/bicarbonate transport system substrate-binding protein